MSHIQGLELIEGNIPRKAPVHPRTVRISHLPMSFHCRKPDICHVPQTLSCANNWANGKEIFCSVRSLGPWQKPNARQTGFFPCVT
jgi:hypothetical protein